MSGGVDFNGDGFDDLIVGAYRGDDGGSFAGEAYVLFGSDGGFGSSVTTGGFPRSVVDVTNLSPSDGFVIQGDAAGDQAGRSVAVVGDMNGDGFGDIVVGAPYGDDAGGGAGEAYVIYGTNSTLGTLVAGRQILDLSNLAVSEGLIIQGELTGDFLGGALAGVGDVNGDGLDDLAIGTPLSDGAGNFSGGAYVVYGSATILGQAVTDQGVTRQVLDLADLTAAQGFSVQGTGSLASTGSALGSAGDVNGDGYTDLIVSAPSPGLAGDAYVLFGNANGIGDPVGARQVLDLATLSASQGFSVGPGTGNDSVGRSVASLDMNGDGFSDVFVGAPYADPNGTSSGEAYVVYGGQFQLGSGVSQVLNGGSNADLLVGESGNDTLNGNGSADVLIGAPGDDVLAVADITFARVDGGAGDDVLALSGSGQTLDLSQPGTAAIRSVETIDLTGSGNNTVTLNAQAVYDLTEQRSSGNTIVSITGSAGDAVNADGFTAARSTTINGISFNLYSDANAML